MTTANVNTDAMLNMKEVADALGISQKALRVRLSKGKFPEPTARKGAELFWSANNLRGIVAPTQRVLDVINSEFDEEIPF